MAHQAEHPAEVGSFGVVLDEAQRARVLLYPSRVRWAFGLVELRDRRALADASTPDQPDQEIILLVRQITARLGHFRGVPIVSAAHRH